MQREIKFRGKRIDTGEWVYGHYYYKIRTQQHVIHLSEYNGVRGDQEYEVIPETVGQFTGLLDKNGNEIYEGDVCRRRLDADNKFHSDGKWCDIWLIEWLNKTAGFTTTKIADYNVHLEKIVSIPQKQNSYFQRFHEMEIICNIYENPELCQKT